MKLVFVAYLHGFGGAERQIILLANEMVARGHEVSLISLSQDNRCYELDKKIAYTYVPDKGSGIMVQINRYCKLKQELKKIKPEATIHFWLQSACFAAFMSKKITGSVIYSERGDPGDKEYVGMWGIVRKIAFPRVDGFVFQSKGAQTYFDKSIQIRSEVIANPVFVSRENYSKVEERRKAIVSVGRLHPQKNHKLLIDAFKLIATKFPQHCLEIYGDGELKEELSQYIDELCLADRVRLMGATKNIHEKIYDATLFVLSSDYEGMPNVLLEAMALGIPAVSTDCRPGGAREIIEDGINGLIVPCEDSEKLSIAMSELLSNSKKAAEYSEHAMNSMVRFSKDNIYTKWEVFFEKTIKRKIK